MKIFSFLNVLISRIHEFVKTCKVSEFKILVITIAGKNKTEIKHN
jgi:hypothetical protein